MSSLKDLKLAQKAALEHQQLINELNALGQDVERSEKTIAMLQQELVAATAKYPTPRTTRQDVEYLTALLKCANKKLVWEKQIASLQKRAPLLLEKMTRLLEDAKNPPPEAVRTEILRALQGLQASMERLQKVSVS